MTQEERWMLRYNEVKSFIETNKRNPSKYYPNERISTNNHTPLQPVVRFASNRLLLTTLQNRRRQPFQGLVN